MSFCIKKYLVFSLRKSNNTKYYRTQFFHNALILSFLHPSQQIKAYTLYKSERGVDNQFIFFCLIRPVFVTIFAIVHYSTGNYVENF